MEEEKIYNMENKENGYYSIDLVLYPLKIFVVIDPTEKFLLSHFRDEKIGEVKLPPCWGDFNAEVYSNIVFNKRTRLRGILMIIHSEDISSSTIVHETTHITNEIWDNISEYNYGEEANAYLTEYIYKRIYDVCKKHLEKIYRSKKVIIKL